MIEYVIKRDGSSEKFDPEKLNKWAEYAAKVGGNWSEIAQKTFKRLQDNCTTRDIHETMVNVCLEKQSLEYSRVASRLEFAEIRKGMEYKLGFDDRSSFKTIFNGFVSLGIWDKSSLPKYNDVWEQWYEEVKQTRLEYWQVKQWADKYACRVEDVVVETPHIGFMGIALALFGDDDKARQFAVALVQGKINLPTPALNGLRNGDWDTISCCVISAGDDVDSIGVANYIAYRMTSKKAGIGIEYTTRSKGDDVKGGRVKHLGKWPILKTLDREVKCMCYDDETEVLTKGGFKLFRDLLPSDLVAQVTHGRKIEFVKPSEYVALPYKGEMYHFHKKGVDVRVTANHQMTYRTVKYDDRTQQTSEGYIFQRADEFTPRRTTTWDFGGTLNGTYAQLTDFDRLQIAYQADGSVRENETTRDSYKFGFKKQRKVERMVDILERLGITQQFTKGNASGFRITKTETKWGEYTNISIRKPNFDLVKSLDWVYDRDWSQEAANQFFEELTHWDGDYTNKGNQLCCYNTTDKTCADAVQYVAAVSNKRSSLKMYDGCYRVYVFDEDSVVGEATNIDVSEYDGIVYCVTVPTHILVVRKNGKTVVCGNTQITRGGNATATLLCIDPEIESALLWKSQRVDIEQRIDKLDYEFGYNDAFVQAVVEGSDWYLFGLKDAPEVYENFYTSSAEEYNAIVQKAIANGSKHKVVKARDLLATFLTVRQETGRFYDHNLTRTNTHTPFVDVIRQSNLCVVPETKVLTRQGHVEIQKLEGKSVEVWNGEEWSAVDVRKTGENQNIIRVVTKDGFELECTPYHKFYKVVQDKWNKPKQVEVKAIDLKQGDKLIKFNLPIIEGNNELENAWTNGFFTGDGFKYQGENRIYFYHEKRNLVPLVSSIAVRHTVDENQNRELLVVNNLMPKYFVPDCSYTIDSRMKWLAGVLDSDGTLVFNGKTQSFQITSINKEFLKAVQLMLQTCGVRSKVTKSSDGGWKHLPVNDGSGDTKLFQCQAAYRLLIGNDGVSKLQDLGLKTFRLKPTEHRPNRECSQFIKIDGVFSDGRVSDTYCFTEPKRHMGMFNGLLTGQCEEITLPTKPYTSMQDLFSAKSEGETAFCSLSAINVANVNLAEYGRVAELALRAVDKMIDKAPMLSPSMEESIKRRRSVGMGITGLASLMYKNGFDYDGSEDSLNFVQNIAEHHYFYLLKASQKLSKEDGVYVEGVNLAWLPVDTAINKSVTNLDWESLRGKNRKHSVLVAHMPTESSAVLSGSSNGLYPIRRKVVNKRSRKGLVQYICTDFVEGVNKVAWDVDNITLSKYYGRIQDNTDQAISCDFYVTPSKFEGGKVSMSQLMKEWVAHAKLGNKTKYYLNTNDYNGGSFQDGKETKTEEFEDGCESCKL